MEIIVFLGLLLLYAYTILNPFPTVFSPPEIVLVVWFAAALNDEFVQVCINDIVADAPFYPGRFQCLCAFLVGSPARSAELAECRLEHD